MLTFAQERNPIQRPMNRTVHPALRTPEPNLQRTCACDGHCPNCKGKVNAQPPTVSGSLPAQTEGGSPKYGPRPDGLEDAVYFGPDDQPDGGSKFGPGTGTGMGCVIGPMRIVTSGALEGGYTVNDYLTGGLSWGAVGSPSTAGVDGKGVKVQMAASFGGDSSLGVSQNFTFSGANQAFLDTAAAYLGKRAGSVKNGDKIDEPVLDAKDPYARKGWVLQYGPKSGKGSTSLVTFADVPRNQAGSKGSVDFETCFHSAGGPCQEGKVCKVWRWTIDFTGSNNTNTVT